MKKIIARLLSLIIYNRSVRRKIRGILEHGLFRTISLYVKIKKNKSVPKFYLSVCAIAKNEGRYFPEWIEFHKMLGVQKFYIYDNESDDNTRDILLPYINSGLVEYNFIPGKKMQLAAYQDCLDKHRFDARWIAFIDLDEFIVPIKHENINAYLCELEQFSAIEINWLCYGSSNEKKHKNGLVIERFKNHSKLNDQLNRHVKSIVNPRCILSFSGAHEAVRISGKSVDASGNIIHKNFFDRAPTGQNIIRIHHYAVKSFAEFLEKRARGRARSLDIRGFDYFNQFDLNDIKNDKIMDKYINTIKQKLL